MHDHESVVSESKNSLSENTWKSSHPATRAPSVRLSRANSEISLFAPVRRRSIIRTPGVATRAETASEASRRTSLRGRHETAASARQSRRNSIERSPTRIQSVPSKLTDLNGQRAVTPSETDYQQLGAMKFGSLRITNGAPSPSSDKRRRKRGSGGQVFVLHNDSNSSLESTPKQNAAVHLKIAEPRPIVSALSPITATFLKLEAGAESQSSTHARTDAGSFANFLPGINFGSFTLSEPRPVSPLQLQTTSKHTAMEDDLLKMTARVHQHPSSARDKTLILSGQDRDSGIVSSPISDYSTQKPFSKTDSGYSSNVSLRSLRLSNGSSAAADKDLPPCPAEPYTHAYACCDADPAKPRGPSTPATPKDYPLPRSNTTASMRMGEAPVNHMPEEVSARSRRSRPPVSLLINKNRASGPLSPDSIQLSPSRLEAPDSGERARKPGPLKRLLSVTSRKSSRGSGLRRSFRNSGSSTASSVSRDSASTPDLRAKAQRDARPSNLANVETAPTDEYEQSAEPRSETPSDRGVQRRRSLQAISSSVVNAAAAVLPSRLSFRRSNSPESDSVDGGELVHEQEQDQHHDSMVPENERWSRSSSAESDVTSASDYTRDALSRNGYDPSFAAMTSARDAYFSPAPSRAPSRAGSVASRSERELDVRLAALKARSNAGSPASFDAGSTHQTYAGDYIYMDAPPQGLVRARSVVQLRIPAPLRPQSASGLKRARSQTSLYRQPSHESMNGFPPQNNLGQVSQDGSTTPPDAYPPQHLHRSLSNRPREQRRAVHALGEREPLFGAAEADSRRPSSANPYSDMQRQASQQQQLRHRASYESQNNSKPRSSHGYFRQSPDLWTSTHYQQLQMQYGGTALDPRAGRFPLRAPIEPCTEPKHFVKRILRTARSI
ncbi:unnamed protein product [Parascedosporium putredinis]|uniref:Uncharacterized protein n=1 Tax=Parascedosporium putredinis TaxID=1442378 RepID=A0A9P1GVJ1_9PEZI|nr:unnamed protein product [Parascedosporium putredinis]CAI7987845.1 unnamed protein product [Parascedosporium putredinis]